MNTAAQRLSRLSLLILSLLKAITKLHLADSLSKIATTVIWLYVPSASSLQAREVIQVLRKPNYGI